MTQVDAAQTHRALLVRCAAGESAALQELYRELAPRALTLALRVLRNRHEAEETLHDVFLEAWRRAGDYDPARGTVTAWLFTMTRSRAIDRLRKNSTRRTETLEGVEATTADGRTPLEDATEKETRLQVRLLLEKIPEEQRRVVELTYFDGLSQPQIAEQIGVPLGTVKTRIRLAMEKLGGFARQLRGRGEA